MEETNSEIVFGPAKLIFGKQYFRLDRGGRYPGFEGHRLLADVVGAEMVSFGSSASPSANDGSFILLGLFALFGSVAYGYRTVRLDDIGFVLSVLIAIFCLLLVLNRAVFSSPKPGANHALQIKLRSGELKIIPSGSPEQVRTAVNAINDFLFSGAYSSQVVIENGIFGLVTTVEPHTR